MFGKSPYVSIYTHVHQVWSLNSRWHFTTHGIRPWISRRFFLGVSIIFEFHSSNFRGVYPPGKNKPQLLVVFFPGPEGWLFPGAFSFGHTVGGNGIDAERSGKFDSYDNHYHRNWKKSLHIPNSPVIPNVRIRVWSPCERGLIHPDPHQVWLDVKGLGLHR